MIKFNSLKISANPLLKAMLAFFISTCLISCGFHLRGQVNLSPALQSLYIKTRTPYSDFTQNLRRYLKMSNVHLTDSAASATTVLQILSENSGQSLSGVNSTLQTRQYNLTLTINFQITDPNGTVLIPQLVATETRTLTVNSNQVLAGSNQADALNQDMRRAVIFDIMNILSSKNVTDVLNKVKLN